MSKGGGGGVGGGKGREGCEGSPDGPRPPPVRSPRHVTPVTSFPRLRGSPLFELAHASGPSTVLNVAREIRKRARAGQPGTIGRRHADVAQLVEHHLAKVRVAGSNPVVRSEARQRGT